MPLRSKTANNAERVGSCLATLSRAQVARLNHYLSGARGRHVGFVAPSALRPGQRRSEVPVVRAGEFKYLLRFLLGKPFTPSGR